VSVLLSFQMQPLPAPVQSQPSIYGYSHLFMGQKGGG
jgi:hypothetical protein